ncbi:MAG: septum site-determining protein MinC [Gloeomargarita sp. DG02_1_bins_92]
MTCLLVQPGAAGLDLTLPPELDWSHLQDLLQQYFQLSEAWWLPQAPVRVVCGARILDGEHWQWLSGLLQKQKLIITTVQTEARATAVAAAMAGYSVEQGIMPPPTASATLPALYLDQAVRAGVEIRHPGTVVLVGDVNPGGCLVADGDILVWGRLRGVAHAGAQGDSRRLIMALEMAATQLRIGELVARTPPSTAFYPEVACVQGDAIVLYPARDFGRTAPGGVF